MQNEQCYMYQTIISISFVLGTVELARDLQNLFVITRFRYIKVLCHIFCHHWSKENRSLERGLRHIEVRYIEVPLQYSLNIIMLKHSSILKYKLKTLPLLLLIMIINNYASLSAPFIQDPTTSLNANMFKRCRKRTKTTRLV